MKKTKTYAEFIGIDISKDKIDVYLHFAGEHRVFSNKSTGFKKLLQWVEKFNAKKGQRLFIFEHCGVYGESLAEYLDRKEEDFAVVSALEVKKSLGIRRGKTDIIDSKRLAEYGYRFQDKLRITKLDSQNLRDLKKLLSERDYYIKQRTGAKNRMKNLEEGKERLSGREKAILRRSKQTFEYADKMVKEIEAEIKELINSDKELKFLLKLIMTVPGVGKWTGLMLIAYTKGFSRFSDWRQFASYIGIAPFAHSSGSSIHGKSHVSNLAHKKLKAKFYFPAIKVIEKDPQLNAYYTRKIKEGKHDSSVRNALKNKIIARVFAVAKRGTPYVILHIAA